MGIHTVHSFFSASVYNNEYINNYIHVIQFEEKSPSYSSYQWRIQDLTLGGFVNGGGV